ncbi:MBL fold metallo-hydrolase [Gammaproteobacteria bacterium]|nr:MBL fold metallo-hydrolase [Gammaproteobacteria bacterium]
MSVNPTDLNAVDYLEVRVLVDNVMDILSSVPDCVTSEIPNLIKAGAKELGGSCLCCGAWGLSLAITTEKDGRRRTLLFDSGPEAYALERNATRLGFDFGTIDCAVFSHGHFDHASGMPKALELITAANGGKKVPIHVNPGMFHKRAARDSPDGSVLPLADVPSTEELSRAGAEVVSSQEPRLVLEDTVYISGEIPRVTDYEKGLPTQVRLDNHGNWIPDPLQLDERYVAVNVRDYGIVVFSACSHAGIVNVLTDAADVSGPVPLYAVMGGLHLSGPDYEPLITRTVKDIAGFQLKRLIVGHCTGWRALQALVNAFGDAVIPEAVGHTHHFGNPC